jgi:hypothetical protein
MSFAKLPILRIVRRKLTVILLLVISCAGAFAALGDGKSKPKSGLPKSSLLSNKSPVKSGAFSLKSGYTYRGNQVINMNAGKRYIRLNSDVTIQKGNFSYIVPLKKKVLLENVKLDISNRQLRRN